MKKISFLVAKSCFMNCLGCYLDPRPGAELSVNEIIAMGKILRARGYEGVTLSGGDPLIRKDIFEIVKGLKDLGFVINLDTVGFPLLRESQEKINILSEQVDLIGIPFDGSSEKIIRQFRDSNYPIYETTKNILETLNDAKFNISINTVVHKGNLHDLPSIYEIINQFENVIRWELHQFVAIGVKSCQIEEEFSVSESEFETAINKIRKGRIKISPKKNSRKANFTYVDFNGDIIKISNGLFENMGNINNKINLLR